jgi:hypothetical protein
MTFRSLIIFLASTTLLISEASADIVSVTTLGDVSADFDGTLDNDSATPWASTISAVASGNNSISQADLEWTWDDFNDSLTGRSLLTSEKTISARPGGDHVLGSVFTLNFDVDAATEISFFGTWGFEDISSGDDTLDLQLTDSSGVIYSTTTTSGIGVASDSFTYSSTLAPGTYTFSLNTTLIETINNRGVSRAGWNLTSFGLTNVTASVPEPSGLLVSAWIPVAILLRRRRNRI